VQWSRGRLIEQAEWVSQGTIQFLSRVRLYDFNSDEGFKYAHEPLHSLEAIIYALTFVVMKRGCDDLNVACKCVELNSVAPTTLDTRLD
jgi:hypothetical protein